MNFSTIIMLYGRFGIFGGSMVKNFPAIAGDGGLISGYGRVREEGNGNPLQYTCLGSRMDRVPWKAIVHKVTKELDTT